MASLSLTGSDTISISGQVITTFADDNVGELTFPNEIAAVKTGKNGNSIYAQNQTGQQAELKLRVLRGGSDDQYLNQLLSNQNANFVGTPLVYGEFIKKVGDGQGNVTSDTYVLSNGVFMKNVEVKSNVSGDTEQSVSIWMLRFASAQRAIG